MTKMTVVKFNLQSYLLLLEFHLTCRFVFLPRYPFINKRNLIQSMIPSIYKFLKQNKIHLINSKWQI